jgi:PilZ domain-containing protein
MAFRIALVGTSEYIRTHLAALLRSAEFDTDVISLAAVPSIKDCRLQDYDMIIASADLTACFHDDTLIESLANARGYLVVEENVQNSADIPSFLINPGMSAEDIIARINNVLYLGSSRRSSPRIRVNMSVEYEFDGNLFQSTILDLSENGLFISTLAPPPVNTRITMHFSLSQGKRPIEAIGRSIYRIVCNFDRSIIASPTAPEKKIVARPGAGIIFDQVSHEDREAIRVFIQQRQ